MINTTPLAKQAASARRAARGPWLLAPVLLPLSQAKAGEPGSPPLALSPTAYRVVYNVSGDHSFRVVPVRAGVVVRRYASGGDGYLDPQLITLPAPMETLAEPSGGIGTQPLVLMAGAPSSSSLGLEITSQSTSSTTTLPNLSAIMGTGFGGISLLQASPAAVNGSNGVGQGSPYFCISGNQWNVSASVAAVWCLQVVGNTVPSSMDAPDVIQWTRPSGTG